MLHACPVNLALPELRLRPGAQKRVRAGHPWAYSNEIALDAAAKALPRGGLVRLVTDNGEPVGVATFNPHTLIAARVLDRDPGATIDADWFAARFAHALALRERLYPGGCYRLVHAEADRLPGLIVDRYGDVVAAQLNSAGMDALRGPIDSALRAVLGPRAVVLRDDSWARGLEGLKEAVEGDAIGGPVALRENGLEFFADLAGGQKTGWFYDQRDNRAAVAALAREARVLDVYAYAGGFGVACAVAGAAETTMVDSSAPALALAARAAEANGGASRCRTVKAEAFAELERLAAAGERFEIVVADPPAFVRSRKDLGAGSRAYRKLARLASSLIAPGGFMFLASCSHNVEPALFAEQVARGLGDAGRSGRVLRSLGAAADHPVHPLLPESAYLKAELLQLD